jgi:thiol-disulfide isomerase/thioredoxin
MTPGLAVLVGALAIALIGGMAWRLTNGRMRQPGGWTGRTGAGSSVALRPEILRDAGIAVPAAQARPAAQGPGDVSADEADGAATAGWRQQLTSVQLGQELGERATLVQFSSAFCAPCRATRRILTDVAGMTTGVAHIEIDAESRLDLVRQLNVLRTPTVLVLNGAGQIVRRASGQPRKPDVIAAIGVAADGGPRADSYN